MRQKRPLKQIVAIMLALIATPNFASYYYSFGKKIELNPVQKSFRVATSRGFQTGSGKELYLSQNELLLKPKKASIESLSKAYNFEVLKKYQSSIYLVKTDGDSIELSAKLFESGDVEFATPNFEIQRDRRTNDPLYPQQWYLKPDYSFFSTSQVDGGASIQIEDAWKISKGKGVKVAVIDDGFDTSHPEISGAISDTYSADRKNSNVTHLYSSGYHGTACAGLIGAKENDMGIKGVAPESQLILIQLTSEYISDTIDAFDAAERAGAAVISNSWGTYNVSEAVASAIENLSKNGRNGKGTVIVFASGNDNKDMTGDESALPSVIGVGSTNSLNVRSWFSNYGDALDIAAPGGGTSLNIATIDNVGNNGTIKNTSTHPDYIHYNNSFAGTSASAPIVAGVAALVLGANPNLSKDEVYDVLTQTADKIGTTPYSSSGKNIYYGYGKLNAKNALERVSSQANNRSINITSGWNLISIPRGYWITPSYFGSIERVWSYNKGVWYTYPKEDGYQEVNYLLKNEGFWIKSSQAKSISFSGEEYEFSMDASSEWQLLGTQKQLNLLNSLYGVSTVWKYTNSEWVQNPQIIEPGEGFWVKK